ncbi:MAG: preprotein translocase subunit SecY, partial [Clostridia bacterium]
MFKTLVNAFADKDIRRKIFLTFGLLLIYRIGCYVPIPGLNLAAVNSAISTTDFNLMNLMSAVSGGALANGTLFALGIIPFINSFIIMQLLTLIIPKLERMSKEGDEGREKLTQITRYIAIGLAIVQGIGIMVSWDNAVNPMFGSKIFTQILIIVILTAGSTFVMWLGERITEYGIGNGTSLIIFIGILSTFGTSLIQAFGTLGKNINNIWRIIAFFAVLVLLFFLIVFIDLSERKVPVKYAKQVRGNKMVGGQSTYIPMKVNSGGVMPIIFASSFLMFPQMIIGFWPQSSAYKFYNQYLGVNSWVYPIALFFFIIFFAYFYAQIQFNPQDVARNIQQYGGTILGKRPGRETSEYLAKINNRMTLFGALFLGFISLVPSLVFKAIGGDLGLTNAFSATGMLIVVSVALEFDKQLQSQLMMRHYKG